MTTTSRKGTNAVARSVETRKRGSDTSVRSYRSGHVLGLLVLAAALYLNPTIALAQINVNSASDAICPAAIQQIKALAVANSTNDPVKIGDLAGKLVRTYDDCITTARTAGQVEPYMHYAQVRAAQYGYFSVARSFCKKIGTARMRHSSKRTDWPRKLLIGLRRLWAIRWAINRRQSLRIRPARSHRFMTSRTRSPARQMWNLRSSFPPLLRLNSGDYFASRQTFATSSNVFAIGYSLS
jgi:hypothetical protein